MATRTSRWYEWPLRSRVTTPVTITVGAGAALLLVLAR
jgi:hypothetical protein